MDKSYLDTSPTWRLFKGTMTTSTGLVSRFELLLIRELDRLKERLDKLEGRDG